MSVPSNIPSGSGRTNQIVSGLIEVGKNVFSGKFFGKKISQVPNQSSLENLMMHWEMVRASDEFSNSEIASNSELVTTIGSLSLSSEEQKTYAQYLKACEGCDFETASPLLDNLITSFGAKPQTHLEEDLQKTDEKDLSQLRNASEHHKTNRVRCFNAELRKKYEAAHADFKKELTEYLVCREITIQRLLPGSNEENTFLLDFMGQKREKVDQKVLFLKTLEKEINEDSDKRAGEAFAADYPELSLEKAREKWFQDIPDSNNS